MNRTNKMPCCSQCNNNYQIGDVYGPKNPMLLVCGHDMCRSCIKYLYKKNNQVICKVCQADCMIKCGDDIFKIPIHYFIVGKVWYSSYNRQRKIYQDISNITMKKLPSKSLIKTQENCQNCQKYAAVFCEQCDEVYCEDCSQEIHMENQIMSQHDLNKIDTTHLEFLQASKCDLHLKINDFICITCEIELCPVCAVENHRHHDVHHLEKYNISQAQRLNEYSLKGDILLKRLKHYRDKFNEKVQKHRGSNFKKSKSEQNKKSISTYVSSVIGTLQCLEQRLFWMIDQADQSSFNSMTHVVGQLSSFIDDLQKKLNLLDVLLKTNSYSSIAMADHIAGIERMLDTTYYLAKKNRAKSSIMFDENIYAAVQRSVLYDIDTSDRYVLGCSPDLLPEYTLNATIGLNSDDNNALSERRPSSVSSVLSSTMSISSNYSAVSGAEAAATFGDISASSADAGASSSDAGASSADAGASSANAGASSADAGAFSADAGASSADAGASSADARVSSADIATGSHNDNTSCDSAAASVVYGQPQSQVVKEIVQNQVELVVVSHHNSPSDFYVQLNANLDVLDMVNIELDRHVKSKHGAVPVDHVEIDNTIMYAVQTSANKWCRGVVLHTFNENNTDLFRVHFIDYGFMETLTADRIKSAPVSVVSISPLAYNCAIYDLKPKYTTGWSNEAYILFNDLMSIKTGSYFLYPLKIKDLRIEVDVVWRGDTDIYPLSVRDAMFFLGHGSYEYYVNKQLHQELVNMITLPDNLKLEEGKRYSVILCHFISPTEFYMRIGDDTAQLEEVMNTLKTIYISTAENTHKSYLLYTPQIGMAVAARYSIDGHWHRAVITSLPEERLVTVFYIDFGNSETLPWDELRVLNKNLIKTPPLVIKASLADVSPAVDGIESTKWSDNACAAFLNFSKIDYADDDLIAFIHKVDGDTHKIVLYNHSSRAEICLNSKLVSQGYATTMDPISCVFQKANTRKQVKQPVLLNSRNKEVLVPSDDTLLFTKLRSVTESENHGWKNKKNKLPGIPMSIVKVVSPDEIILKKMDFNTDILTEKMNKVYGDKTKKKTILDWKINDLCAILIKKYGNWYRGKIINMIKNKVTVYFYDLNETIDEIPIKTLHVLEQDCGKLKCGFLHCGLSNLVPLGASDGIWPKFSCDRLIEELKKYPTVYFSNQGKKNGIAIGEIWVRVIDIPRALEPIREHWTNINKFMVEQGFALSKKQVKMDGEYSTLSQSESEFNYSSVSKENYEFVNSWMPPNRLVKSQFNAIVTNVDFECNIYFQIVDDETSQSLQLVTDELNYIFSNSQPEPINMKWSQGQSVIVKYYQDKKWYRGTILKIDEKKKEFTVQFYDYGNIETCKHEELRSTLHTTEVPQLCHRGYFSAILPITKNGKWPVLSLDHIHNIIVEKTCRMTVNENLSTDDVCAIKSLKLVEDNLDVFQYLVTEKHAYFEYVSSSIIDLVDTDEINNGNAANDNISNAAKDNISNAAYDNISNATYDNGHDDVNGGSMYDSGGLTYDERRQSYDDGARQTYDDGVGQTYDNGVVAANAVDEERATSVGAPGASAVILDEDDGEESGYSKFCLERNEVVEGTMCRITGPTSLTLVITKIGGVDLSVAKNDMHKAMSDKCSTLPPPDHIIPGTAVIVHHNVLWRRGLVEDGGKSVYLVDFGTSIKLVKKNLRRFIAEFFELPMFTIDCRLENVRPSDDADAEDVVKKLSKTLRGVSLKIVGISESDDGDIIGVELYNSKEEIAYQSVVDANLLIPVE